MKKSSTKSSVAEQAKDATKINQELYKRNFELAVRNQTLSTLRSLYELANTTLDFKALSERLAYTLTQNLSVEISTIFLSESSMANLTSIAFAASERTQTVLQKSDFNVERISFETTKKNNPIVKSFSKKQLLHVNDLYQIYDSRKDRVLVKKITKKANLKHSLLFPLFTENRNIGVLVLVLNKFKKDITNYELEDMQRFTEVISVSLDKALVYEDLRVANTKLKELDEAKSEFMSIASHQLRTPLAGIIGYLSMMVEGDYGKFQKNQMDTITEVFHASQRLVHLVNTFLNVTRIEAGRFTLSFVPTNLVEIVDQQVKELLPTANKKGVKLSFDQPKDAIIEAEVDDKIRDVFLNLVDNAIKYTPEGSVTAAIKKDGRDKVHFTCTDTGVGIAKDEVSHLFEKFVRGNSIAKVQPDGSGLGLYIVKRIVEGHNGQLWAESEGVGKGTTFHVVVPVKQKQKQFKAQAEAVFEGKTKPGEGGSTVRKNTGKKPPQKKAQEK